MWGGMQVGAWGGTSLRQRGIGGLVLVLFSCWCLVYTATNLTNLYTPDPVLCIIINIRKKCGWCVWRWGPLPPGLMRPGRHTPYIQTHDNRCPPPRARREKGNIEDPARGPAASERGGARGQEKRGQVGLSDFEAGGLETIIKFNRMQPATRARTRRGACRKEWSHHSHH